MKIELDYDNKIIRLENQTKLSIFVEKIQKILPDWKEWTLDTNTTINWNNPVVINPSPYIPVKPWWEHPYIWCDDGQTTVRYFSDTTTEPITGTHQIEVK